MNDTGLLAAMYGIEFQLKFLMNNIGESKGGFFENAIANIVVKNNKGVYYYKPYENSSEDIEIVFDSKQNIKLVEVKSSNSKAKTLNNSINKHTYGIKVTNTNIGYFNNILTIP
ncbi:hypothetical protein FACS189459_4880 [Bacilli bacterium]|nr:hypothetical protein FACS189459_4880 [Bacilli bacterium]